MRLGGDICDSTLDPIVRGQVGMRRVTLTLKICMPVCGVDPFSVRLSLSFGI
jgi:hypothetical protein